MRPRSRGIYFGMVRRGGTVRDFVDVMQMYGFFFCILCSFVRLFGFRMIRVHANWIRIMLNRRLIHLPVPTHPKLKLKLKIGRHHPASTPNSNSNLPKPPQILLTHLTSHLSFFLHPCLACSLPSAVVVFLGIGIGYSFAGWAILRDLINFGLSGSPSTSG